MKQSLQNNQISPEPLWFSLNKDIAYSHWVLIRGQTLSEIAFLRLLGFKPARTQAQRIVLAYMIEANTTFKF